MNLGTNCLPAEVMSMVPHDLRTWCKSRFQNNTSCWRFKVYVFGEQGSGKTTLIHNISKNWQPAERYLNSKNSCKTMNEGGEGATGEVLTVLTGMMTLLDSILARELKKIETD